MVARREAMAGAESGVGSSQKGTAARFLIKKALFDVERLISCNYCRVSDHTLLKREGTRPIYIFYMTLLNSYKDFYKIYQVKRYNDSILFTHNNTIYEEVYIMRRKQNTYEPI